MPTYTEDQLKRYISVHNLAEQSPEAAERVTAGRIRGQMEEKYPGIGLEALRWEDSQRKAASSPPPPPPRPTSPPHATATPPPPSQASQNWWARTAQELMSEFSSTAEDGNGGSGWTRVAGTVFKAAQNYNETVVNADAGKQFADAVATLEEGKTRSGIVKLTVSVPMNALVTAKTRMNEAQKQAFARALGDKIAARLYAFLVA